MLRSGWKEHVALVLPMVLLVLMDDTWARPRRRFCEYYPFAPRCLGVAAKRSTKLEDGQAPLEIYSDLIKRVLEGMKREPAPSEPLQDQPSVYRGGDTILDRLMSLVDQSEQKNFKGPSYPGTRNAWDDGYAGSQRDI